MSKITDRSIRTSNWGLPGTRPTSTRAFTGASSAERILNSRIVGTSDAIRIKPGRRISEGGHQIRWPSREEIATLVQRGPRRRTLESSTSRVHVEPRVPGLLVVPQATSDGELYRFITKYKVHLADAGGSLLTWMRIGDPQDQDSIFRDQLSAATEPELKAWVAEYEAGVQHARSEEHYIDGENLNILKALGLPQRTLPAIFFLAPQPVLSWAVLRLDVAMFIDPIAERALSNHLIEDLASGQFAPYARGGGFTAARMQPLQCYLDFVEQEIRKGTNVRIEPPALVAGHQGKEPAPYQQPSVAPETYALAYGPGGDWRPLSKDEYRQQSAQFADIDYIIDAVARRCYKRRDRSMPHQEADCTVAQLRMISEMVLRPGLHHPYALRAADSSAAEVANRMMQAAILKVEEIKAADRVRLFSRQKGIAAKEHRYEFAPPADVSWRLIVPVT